MTQLCLSSRLSAVARATSVAVALSACALISAHAAGAADATFGSSGRVVTDFVGGHDTAHAVAVQADGRVVVVGQAILANGTAAVAVARYLPSGALDTSFNGSGRLTIASPTVGGSQWGTAVSIQATDQRILIAGPGNTGAERGLFITRLNANGSIDTGFGTSGRTFLSCALVGCEGAGASRILTLSSGSIWVLGGYALTVDDVSNFGLVAAVSSSGSPLTALGPGGVKGFGDVTGLNGAALPLGTFNDGIEQGNGVVYVGSVGSAVNAGVSELAIGKLLAIDASHDTSFGTTGRTQLQASPGEQLTSIVALPDGRLVAAGGQVEGTVGAVRLRRFSANGALDASIAEPPITLINSIPLLARNGSGFWLAGSTGALGGSGNFNLFSLTGNGAIDTTFGSGGSVSVDFGGEERTAAMAVGADGKPVLAGFVQVGIANANFAVARIDPLAGSGPAPTAPAAPSNLTASVLSASAIGLAWRDNASNETGYLVERATTSSFNPATTLTTTAANATSFTSTGLAANTTYFFRVTALNGAGRSASVTTSARTSKR